MTLLAKIRSSLRTVAEPARAAGMRAYMKSAMPYLGVTAPKLTAACRDLFASYPFETRFLARGRARLCGAPQGSARSATRPCA